MAEKTCGAEFPAGDDTFVCTLKPGHDGPVHRSEDGHEWGDQALPQPQPADG